MVEHKHLMISADFLRDILVIARILSGLSNQSTFAVLDFLSIIVPIISPISL